MYAICSMKAYVSGGRKLFVIGGKKLMLCIPLGRVSVRRRTLCSGNQR